MALRSAHVVLEGAVLAGVEAPLEGDHDQNEHHDRADREDGLTRSDLLPAHIATSGRAAAAHRSASPSRGRLLSVVVVEEVHGFRAFRQKQYDPCRGGIGRLGGDPAGGAPGVAKSHSWLKESSYSSGSRLASASATAGTGPSIVRGDERPLPLGRGQGSHRRLRGPGPARGSRRPRASTTRGSSPSTSSASTTGAPIWSASWSRGRTSASWPAPRRSPTARSPTVVGRALRRTHPRPRRGRRPP